MNLDSQIHAICDILSGDAGFMAQQEATALQNRAGEAAMGQAVTIKAKSDLALCSDYHAKLAGRYAIAGNIPEADMHLRWAVACSEADEQ